MDKLLQKGTGEYINTKADACALIFDDDDQLVKSEVYDRMRGSVNNLEPYLKDLSEFAQKTNFRAFYDKNRPYYDSLIQWQRRAINTQKQWDWLESQFPDHHYDHYWITFSPLVKGNHGTSRFDNNGFKVAVMFIRPPYRIESVSEEVSNGLVTRIIFTEIDHNYVNPESDKYIDEINMYFSDNDIWTNEKESGNYGSPYAVFNEYMTWSVYLLYCYDQYDADDFEVINNAIVNYKINTRGFIRFDDFHGEMLQLYKGKNPGQTVADLYPALLDWASTYQPD